MDSRCNCAACQLRRRSESLYLENPAMLNLTNEDKQEIKELLTKILNAQSKSRSVTLHEEDGNKCDHNETEINFDSRTSKCSKCGRVKTY